MASTRRGECLSNGSGLLLAAFEPPIRLIRRNLANPVIDQTRACRFNWSRVPLYPEERLFRPPAPAEAPLTGPGATIGRRSPHS